jgi:hypothetical protein
MKISELIEDFEIFVTNEESEILKKISGPVFLDSFSERERFIIEGMIRKSLVIKIGTNNPKVIANEF